MKKVIRDVVAECLSDKKLIAKTIGAIYDISTSGFLAVELLSEKERDEARTALQSFKSWLEGA